MTKNYMKKWKWAVLQEWLTIIQWMKKIKQHGMIFMEQIKRDNFHLIMVKTQNKDENISKDLTKPIEKS